MVVLRIEEAKLWWMLVDLRKRTMWGLTCFRLPPSFGYGYGYGYQCRGKLPRGGLWTMYADPEQNLGSECLPRGNHALCFWTTCVSREELVCQRERH